jgi:hypothetical protein
VANSPIQTEDANEKVEKGSDEEILAVARKRFEIAEEAWSEIRQKALEDLEFLAGEQWHPNDKQQRLEDGRPILTINRLPQIMQQITNDQRQNRPSMKVSPVDDKADVEVAKILQGLLRHIQVNSNADVAYDTAFEGAVGPGFGFFRIRTDYCDHTSFDQEALIERIRDHFSVLLDPFSKEPDGSDANWGFIFEDVSKDDYEAANPGSKLNQENNWDTLASQAPTWVNGRSVRVAEYFYKEFVETEIVLLSDGKTYEIDKIPPNLEPGLQIMKRRKTMKPIIKWCKINGLEILEKTIFPGRFIPIIPVYGKEYFVNGKRIIEGMIRNAKDPQRMYNYWATAETEMIALAPKAPYIIAEGQIPPEYENQWKTANKKNHAFLPYKATSIAGIAVPPPQRNTYESPVQAITNARLQASEDMKATTGIYDAALGARSNETSGVAINSRKHQAQTSNFHFVDNLTRSLRHAGKILIEIIPVIYDATRAQRIIGDDGEQQMVVLNGLFKKPNGEQVITDLSIGKYDVVVETGPSFETRRQEAVASLLDFIQIYPAAAQFIGDLLAKNMDWPGASEISERLRKMIPPGIVEDKNQKPIPPEVQAQIQQQMQLIQQLTEQLKQQNEIVNQKRMELESRERIELMKIERDYKLEILKMQGSAANSLMEREFQQIDRRESLLNIDQPINPNQSFNGMGPDQAPPASEPQQPTGGLPPGQFMGE